MKISITIDHFVIIGFQTKLTWNIFMVPITLKTRPNVDIKTSRMLGTFKGFFGASLISVELLFSILVLLGIIPIIKSQSIF